LPNWFPFKRTERGKAEKTHQLKNEKQTDGTSSKQQHIKIVRSFHYLGMKKEWIRFCCFAQKILLFYRLFPFPKRFLFFLCLQSNVRKICFVISIAAFVSII